MAGPGLLSENDVFPDGIDSNFRQLCCAEKGSEWLRAIPFFFGTTGRKARQFVGEITVCGFGECQPRELLTRGRELPLTRTSDLFLLLRLSLAPVRCIERYAVTHAIHGKIRPPCPASLKETHDFNSLRHVSLSLSASKSERLVSHRQQSHRFSFSFHSGPRASCFILRSRSIAVIGLIPASTPAMPRARYSRRESSLA